MAIKQPVKEQRRKEASKQLVLQINQKLYHITILTKSYSRKIS